MLEEIAKRPVWLDIVAQETVADEIKDIMVGWWRRDGVGWSVDYC